MADNTAKAEGAQALFCSIADYLGDREVAKSFDKNKYKSYGEFLSNYTPPSQEGIGIIIQKAYKQNVKTDATLQEIEQFLLEQPTWFHSSMNIAKKMIAEVEDISRKFSRIKRTSWSDIFYVRGDQEIMGTISELFKRANETLKKNKNAKGFGNINKWSPADIYFASDKSKKILRGRVSKNDIITFDELNETISNLIESGDLLPLSLKKQSGEVTVEKVNFDSTKGTLPYIFGGIGGKEKDARSLIINLSKKGGIPDLVYRHDASTSTLSGGTVKVAIRLGGSFGGSLSGLQFADAVDKADKTFGSIYRTSVENARKNFAREFKQEIAKRLPTLTKIDKAPDETDPKRKVYVEIRERVSKKYFTDSPNGPHQTLKRYLIKNVSTGKSTKLIKTIVTVAGGKSDYSAKYIIAK